MCTVTVTSVRAVTDPRGAVRYLLVAGSSEGCAGKVSVTAICDGPSSGPLHGSATPDELGIWGTTLDATNTPGFCGCGGLVEVTGTCVDNHDPTTSCTSPIFLASIPCCWDIAVAVSIGECDRRTGTTPVTFTATATPPSGCTAPLDVAWWPDPATLPRPTAPTSTLPCTAGGAPVVVSETYSFTSPGPASPPQLIIFSPRGCSSPSIALPPLPTCSKCPTASGTALAINEQLTCDPSGKSQTVVLTATPDSTPATVVWTLPDGTVDRNPTTPKSYPVGTTQTFVLSVSSPGCPTDTAPFALTIPACEGGGPGAPTGGRSGGCAFFPYAIAIAVGLALAAGLLALVFNSCFGVPVPAYVWIAIAATVALGAALLGLWYLLCNFGVCTCPTLCDYLQMAWIAAIVPAVLGTYFLPCCSGVIETIVTVAYGLSIAAMLAWLVACRPTACMVAYSVVTATVTALGSIFGVLNSINLAAIAPSCHPYSAAQSATAYIAALAAAYTVYCAASSDGGRK